MAEIKDKVVTVESLSALHEHNKETYIAKTDVVSVENGGTGATTTEEALTNLGLTAYVDGVKSDIQTQIDGKQATITGGATTIASNDLTASRVLVSNDSGKVAVSDITSAELGYLDGVTSSVQSQLDGKSASDHTHDYLSLGGGALTGGLEVKGMKLTNGIDYGDELPTDNSTETIGRIFFKKLIV